jgi:hypothetical protein
MQGALGLIPHRRLPGDHCQNRPDLAGGTLSSLGKLEPVVATTED